MQQQLSHIPSRFISFHFTDSIEWTNHLPFDNMTRSTQRCVIDSRTFFLSKKGYNAKSLPVVVLMILMGFSHATLWKYITKISWRGWRSFTISLLCVAHYKHRTLLLLCNVHVCLLHNWSSLSPSGIAYVKWSVLFQSKVLHATAALAQHHRTIFLTVIFGWCTWCVRTMYVSYAQTHRYRSPAAESEKAEENGGKYDLM